MSYRDEAGAVRIAQGTLLKANDAVVWERSGDRVQMIGVVFT
jgi:hypothetical protein